MSAVSQFDAIIRELPEGMRWHYKAMLSGDRIRHQWAIVNKHGGIHVDAWLYKDEWLGGIEGHSFTPMYEYNADKPSHEHCWLLGAPCWHDGSSLQFSEEIAPMLPYRGEDMGEPEHRAVLSVMLHRHRTWLPDASFAVPAS